MKKYTSMNLWVVAAVFVSATGAALATPPVLAPDGGSSALLLGVGALGAAVAKRFFGKSK